VVPATVVKPAPQKRKRSFKEQRELEGMEQAVEVAEARKAAAEQALVDPANFTGQGANRMPALQRELDEATRAVEVLYARWQVLQDLAAG
jgi:ATP-binding cassette subfamily F protein uup